MAGRIVLGIANPALDTNGRVDSGATLTFYEDDATTLQSVYSDDGLGTALANPLSPDAAGRFPQLWAADGSSYHVKWTPAGASAITYENIKPETPVPTIPASATFTVCSTTWVSGNGSVPSTGVCDDFVVPFDCAIIGWYLQADQSGSLVLDLWKTAFATDGPPTVVNTITASAKPTLSSHQQIANSSLTGWTTSVSAGDAIRVNIDSISTITRFVLTLKLSRSIALS